MELEGCDGERNVGFEGSDGERKVGFECADGEWKVGLEGCDGERKVALEGEVSFGRRTGLGLRGDVGVGESAIRRRCSKAGHHFTDQGTTTFSETLSRSSKIWFRRRRLGRRVAV